MRPVRPRPRGVSIGSLPSDPAERLLVAFALLVALGGAALLVAKGGVASYRHQMRIGHVIAGEKLSRRERGHLRWRRISGDAPVYLSDTLRTGTEPAVVLFENGRRLHVPADTIVRVDDVKPMQVDVTVLAGRMPASDDVFVRMERGAELKRATTSLLAFPQVPVPLPAARDGFVTRAGGERVPVPHVDVPR